jgi:bile acid:Na+ symporter, BASS family
MSIATLLPLAIKISLTLAVLALGLKASAADALYLFRRPAQLLRAVLAMDVIVPLIVVGLAAAFVAEPAVKIGLVTLALAPLPATFSKKPLKAGGKISYTVGLFLAITLIAVIYIPLALKLLATTTGVPMQMSSRDVWTLVFGSLLVPLIFGIALHQLAPTFAERAAKPVAQVADVLLLIAVIPILIRVWPAVFSLVGNGTVLIMLVIAMLALATGHLLGGPDPEDRGVLALASSARHPGIALAIAHLNFPDQKLAPAAVILYLLVSAIVTAPYLKWTARHHSHVASAMSPSSA